MRCGYCVLLTQTLLADHTGFERRIRNDKNLFNQFGSCVVRAYSRLFARRYLSKTFTDCFPWYLEQVDNGRCNISMMKLLMLLQALESFTSDEDFARTYARSNSARARACAVSVPDRC